MRTHLPRCVLGTCVFREEYCRQAKLQDWSLPVAPAGVWVTKIENYCQHILTDTGEWLLGVLGSIRDSSFNTIWSNCFCHLFGRFSVWLKKQHSSWAFLKFSDLCSERALHADLNLAVRKWHKIKLGNRQLQTVLGWTEGFTEPSTLVEMNGPLGVIYITSRVSETLQ